MPAKRNILLSLTFIALNYQNIYSQSTFNQIYQLLNSSTCGNNFNSCHNGSAPSGLQFNVTEQQLYDELYFQPPHNNTANSKGDKLVYPGHPYRSFLFRKINNGLAHNIDLVSGEGVSMPQSLPAINEKQIELIRQWIIYGAPFAGEVIDTNIITSFYDNAGISSVSNPPSAPAIDEGFQIHHGPYFLAPGSENLGVNGSPFNRFDIPLSDSVEINRIECFVGNGFHHLGFFNYPDTNLNSQIPYGIIPGQSLYPILNFNLLENMATFQHSDAMNLPNGTALKFPYQSPLFIADHYLNPSTTKVLSCDVYLNVYYQPKHTALQVMKHQSHNYSDNPANPQLMLPPDGQLHTFSENIFDTQNGETRFIWALLAHSHIHTVSYDIYKRNPNGTTGAKIYEAGCTGGLPDCTTPVFQPNEIPTRYFNDFIDINTANGFYREASFRNNGPDTIFSGMFATTDEMMAMAYYYITDTTGLGILNGIKDNQNQTTKSEVYAYPNPFSQKIVIDWRELNGYNPSVFSIYDIVGKKIFEKKNLNTSSITITSDILSSKGLYFYILKTKNCSFSGKIVYQ